tara:strand:+ start:24650 stop:25408 length:759 start_codon:yes stop_codon:yes gene_type:complete
MALLTQYELYRLFEKMKRRVLAPTGMGMGAFLCLTAWYLPHPFGIHSHFLASLTLLSLALVTSCILLMFVYIIVPGYRKGPSPLSSTLWGIIYVPFMLQFYVRLIQVFAERGDATVGVWLVVWLIAVAKFTDVGGLLTGMLLGQHKFAPSISPAKTWEGVGGGILLAVILGIAINIFAVHYMPASFTVPKAIACAVPISILAIFSDLIQSAIKRRAKMKDSGGIIPGIGGMFDLTDSLILVAPLGFFLLHTL